MTRPGLRATLPAALAIGAFALCYSVAQSLSRAGVFDYVDVLFDTDAAWFLRGFADGVGTGMGWGARSLVHPNVANFVNPPLRLIAEVLGFAGAGEAALLRPKLAVLVSPMAVAAETMFVFLTIRLISGSGLRAALAALLNLALLPTLVFGAVPESFALTGCAFAALFYLTARAASGRPANRTWWVLLGVAMSSLTVTNLWLFALGCAMAHSSGRWLTRGGVTNAARLSALAFAVTAILALVIGSAYRALDDYRTPLQQLGEIRAPREDLAERRWLDAARDGAVQAASGAFVAFPRALGDTVLPPRPSVHGTALGLDTSGGSIGARSEPSLHANFRNASADWGTLLALVSLAGAAIIAATHTGPGRTLYRTALVLIAANWVFHSIFGIELFLYAKHWSVAVAIVLVGWCEWRRSASSSGVAIVVVLIALAAGRSVLALGHLLRALSPG